MIFQLLLFIVLFSFQVKCFGQWQVSMNARGALGPNFVGYKLDSTGIFAGMYVWDKSIFGGKCCKYESIKIDWEDLDKLTLHRINLLLSNHEFFKKDHYFYAEITGNPQVFEIIEIGELEPVKIVVYSIISSNEKEQYLLSELQYLLTQLIPEKHNQFKFYPSLYYEISEN